MFAQCLSKGAERFGTAPFDHQQQPRPVAIQHVGDGTVSSPGAGLVNSYPAHLAPVASCLGLLDVMDQHSPQTSISLTQQSDIPSPGIWALKSMTRASINKVKPLASRAQGTST